MSDRIVVLMHSRENSRLLSEWLAGRYEVIVPGDGALPEAEFDLCVIDGPSLERLRAAVESRKQREAPAFLPFLFVALRHDMHLVARHLYTAVDELIIMPTTKLELAARLESLLRSRRHSVALSRQNADMFAGLVEASPLGVLLGRDGRYFYVNRAAGELFGYRPEEIVARLGPLDLACEADHALVAEQVARLEQGRAATIHYAMRGRRRDGSPFACEVFERLVTFDGRPARLAMLMDVSERQALEAERERTIEALQHADQLKDQFLSILSHELRTPLNAVLGFGSVLADEVAGELTPMQHTYVNKMLNGAEVLLSLITDLLDMSRIQAGKFLLTRSQVDLAAVAEEVAGQLEGIARAKHIAIAVDAEPGLPTVEGDAQRIGQILTNLIGNAIKFTPAHGAIRVAIRPEHRMLLCEVSDSGIGIDEADIGRLFQPFSQVDMSDTRAAGGTGLGLSIAKALVETHGGRIGVRSTPGHGSTFWFSLPVPPGAGEVGRSPDAP